MSSGCWGLQSRVNIGGDFRGWMDGPTKGEERVRNGTVDKITHSLAETERILFHEELIRRHTVHVNTLFEILLRQDAS